MLRWKKIKDFIHSKNRLIFSVILIFCALFVAIFSSLSKTIDIPTFHLDGSFQTASGLYRLESGQSPGKDFYPYLGIGPLYMLYPFFTITGYNLAASVFASYFVICVTSALSVGIIWYLIWKPNTLHSSLIVGSLFLIMVIGNASLSSFSLPDWLTWSIQPGNSLRPLRAHIPYIITVSTLILFSSPFLNQKQIGVSIRYIISGCICGITALWSNDFALPTMAFYIFFLILYAKKEDGLLTKNIVFFFLSTIIFSTLLFSIVSSGHILNLLRYNFLDVAPDQWWYFGSYDASTRIFSITDILKLISTESFFPLIILSLVFVHSLREPSKENIALFWIGAVLFLGGSLASIGGHTGGYFGGFYFWGAITSIISCIKVFWNFGTKSSFIQNKDHRILTTVLVLILAWSGTTSIATHKKFLQERLSAQQDTNRFYIQELGGYLPISWIDYIKLAREDKDGIVFEEYWGIWSALQRTFPPIPIDSIIHALGKTRTLAEQKLQTADTITTTRYSFSPEWQSWNLSQNYWFYKKLLTYYQPIAYSPNTIVWKKMVDNQDIEVVSIPCTISEDKTKFSVEPPSKDFYEANIHYQLSGTKRALIMAENNIDYGGDADGRVSLNPRESIATFPIYPLKEGRQSFALQIEPTKDQSHISIESCSIRSIPFKDPEVLVSPEHTFYLTDKNWVRGISRNFTGFFVPNKPAFTEKAVPGNTVVFPNGDERTILWTNSFKQYFNVYVSGNILDSDVVGYPNNFIIKETPFPKE